jgi:tetratricopeptide (TPR) repeat protein
MRHGLARQPPGFSKPDIQNILGQALALLQTGCNEEALQCLATRPEITRGDSFACYLAGLINVNLGQDTAALPFYDRALALKPDYADAIEARARLMQRAGRFDDAVAAYDALFAFKPAAALAAKAAILHGLDRGEEAFEAYYALTSANPCDATAWYNCGSILAARGEQGVAYEYFHKALECDPNYGMALYGAATALQKLDWPDEALAVCDKLLAQAPADFNAWFLRGNLLYSVARAPEALAAFEKALALSPGNLSVLCNRGETLRQLGRFPEAAAMFDEALAKNPRSVEALLGRGIIEFKNARTENALLYFNTALEADPRSATAFTGRALAMQELGCFDEAMADFKRALVLAPGLVEGHCNLGALQRLLGDFENGWEGDEYRKLWDDECKINAKAVWPVWNGEPIAGKKLLVLDEAAHGDIIMLARYFPVLAGLGAKVTFKCRPWIIELIKNVPGVRIVAKTDPGERFDYQVHLFSLPRVLKTRIDTIPASVPYIEADPALAAKWAGRLGSHGFKIGIAWQGNPNPKVDMARAAPLAAFAPVAAIPNVRLISLQKGFGTGQLADCKVEVETLGEDFDAGPNAFIDTAAVMANLDLIVSVDTSVAHLAGAMGRPVFVALKHVPEWRWMLDRADSPWYPTMRLFRQPKRGYWTGVFESIAKAVAALSKAPATPLQIPAPIGELFDKITILEIKAGRIPDAGKRTNVERELTLLQQLRQSRGLSGAGLDRLTAELKRTNSALWDIEDAIRKCERLGDFGPAFIELARSVYKENDKRAALKREINMLCASPIVEEKYFPAE